MNLKLSETLVTLQHSRLSEIPPIAAQQLNLIRQELKRLNERVKKETDKSKKQAEQFTKEEQAFQKAHIALLFDQIYRIKRFLMLYHTFRCDRIEDQFWFYGGDVKNSEKSNLSETEKAYFSSYKDMIMDYVEEIGVDLTNDLSPPLAYEVEYHMLEDCGQILDDFGHPIKLEKNSRGFIKRRLIQKFVRQGQAEIKKK